jgi:hypothetical protein
MWSYLFPVVAGAVGGAVVAGLLLWWQQHHSESAETSSVDPIDPWVEAEIDQAAATWATAHGQPEAAPFVADKLRLLHRLGSERRRSS